MVGKLGIGLLSIVALYGQSGSGTTSIYYTIYANASAGAASATVPNIGQIGHQVFLKFSNAPAKTCTAVGNTIQAQLEFSYDNSSWTAFGTPNADPTIGVLSQTYFGNGVYPFVRFNLSTFDTTNCRVNGYYTGTSNSAALGSPAGTINTLVPSNAIVSIGGGISSQRIAPIRICDVVDVSSAPQAAGTVALESLPTSGFGSILGYCGITATSTGVSTIQLVQGTGTGCTSPTILSPIYNLVAGVPVNVGSVYGVLFTAFGQLGDHVCLVVTGVATNYMVLHTVI